MNSSLAENPCGNVNVEMENQSLIDAPLAANAESTTVAATTLPNSADTIDGNTIGTPIKQAGLAVSSAGQLLEGVGKSLETGDENIVNSPIAVTKNIISDNGENARNVTSKIQAAAGSIRRLFSKSEK